MRFLLDSSAIIAMARSGQLDLLRRVVVRGHITAAVREEILGREDETTAAIRTALDEWITTARGRTARLEYLRLGLHAGEASLLAIAQKGDVVVIDEKHGRALANVMGLTCVGLLGLLLGASHEGRIGRGEAREALDALERAGFWVSPHLRIRFRRELEREGP